MPSKKDLAIAYYLKEADKYWKLGDKRMSGAMLAEAHNWKLGMRSKI